MGIITGGGDAGNLYTCRYCASVQTGSAACFCSERLRGRMPGSATTTPRRGPMRHWLPSLGLILLTTTASAQDRDAKVRNDRKTFQASQDWIYNDLGEGVRVAKASGKPLLVVF